MKKLINYIYITLAVFIISSCDDGFDELNINKTAATTVNPVFILNNATINTSFTTSTCNYEIGIVQQIISPNSGVLTGANFNQDNRDNTQQIWQRYYRSVIRNTVDVINLTKDVPARSNLYNMARIWQSYAFMVLTDTYGEVPYSEAGIGFISSKFYPAYETQQAIYAGIIKELGEAAAALDAAKTIETADIIYAGDISKWKKFSNSLLLRAGMHLSEVDAAQAKTVVAKAFAAGVLSSNADNCFLKHDPNYTNGIGQMLNSTEANNFYMAAPFVDFLKTSLDPRLKSIAVRYIGAATGTQQVAARASTDPTAQIGMPMGYDNNGIIAYAKSINLASFYDFTQIDRARLVKNTAPMFFVTHAQTQLLLAEAAFRGWITGNAADFYIAGVKAHMEQMAAYDAASAIPAASIDTYIKDNPLTAGKELEQINNQYWIASFLNGPEVFANFRRSGFPKLTANPFTGKSIKGLFINRLTYPNSEISVNADNVKTAIGRQGADDLDTKVWWDK